MLVVAAVDRLRGSTARHLDQDRHLTDDDRERSLMPSWIRDRLQGAVRTHNILAAASEVNGLVEVDRGPIDVHDEEADWSKRSVTAPEFASWLGRQLGARRIAIRGIRVTQADGDDIASDVDLRDFHTDAALVLRDCRIDARVDLSGAEVGRLGIERCIFGRGLNLEGARLGGSLTISDGARVAADADGWALWAYGLEVAGSVFIKGEDTQMDGALALDRAKILGRLAPTLHGSDGGVVVAV